MTAEQSNPWLPPLPCNLAASTIPTPFIVHLESIITACIAPSIWFQKRGPEKLSGRRNMIGSKKNASPIKREEDMEGDPCHHISSEFIKPLARARPRPYYTESLHSGGWVFLQYPVPANEGAYFFSFGSFITNLKPQPSLCPDELCEDRADMVIVF